MFDIQIHTAVFSEKLAEYARLLGKGIGATLGEQAKLLCDRLQKLTYPKNASQGKKRVTLDIQKVFLLNKWFEETFSFRNEKLGDRIKAAVRGKDEQELTGIFSRFPRLRKLHVEPFDKDRHARARKDGRVFYKGPNSFPVSQQKDVKRLIEEKKKAVGSAKAGWASAGSSLGGSVPAWLRKPGTGEAVDLRSDGTNPRITLINRVRVFAEIDKKAGIVSRSLAGRARDMIKSAERQLKEAARKAKLSA